MKQKTITERTAIHPSIGGATDDPSRRSFLKLGLISSGVLSGAGMIAGSTGCSATPSTQTTAQLKLLRPQDVVILESLAPIVLAGAFPSDPQLQSDALQRLIEKTDDFLFRSSPFNHQGLADLFDLLYMPATRIALAGVWNSWEKASDSSKEQFLRSWRDSRFALFRTGYTQITQLLAICWYKDPLNWNSQIYPGPPKHIV